MSIELGLAKILTLLSLLDNPQNSFDCIHVTGTNGKGSVGAIAASVLRAAGIRCGHFSSPHLISPGDSIQVQGVPIADDELSEVSDSVSAVNAANDVGASSFEILTAVAFVYFKSRKVEVALVEVGMGGRRDATNVFSAPAVCVFTAISLDHTEYLGDTVEEIALEKSGILKSGAICVLGSQKHVSAAETVEQQAASLQANVVRPHPVTEVSADSSLRFRTVQYLFGGKLLTSTFHMLGDHQLENLGTALSAVEALLRARAGYSVSEEAVSLGIGQSRWRGRLDYVDVNGRVILIDGAHNEAGASALGSYVDKNLRPRSAAGRVSWIVGFKDGKAVNVIMRFLLRPGDDVTCVPFSKPVGMPWISPTDPAAISTLVTSHHPLVDVTCASDIGAVLSSAAERWKENDSIVMCGSLYLLADFYRCIL